MSASTFREDWEKAMAWWGDPSSFNSIMIRRLARRRLSLHLAGTGQGISSSDINHEVFNLWQEYKADKADTANKYNCVFNWVLDKLNAIEEAVS